MACSHHSSSIRRVCSGDTHICVQKIYRSTLFVSIRWQHRCRHASAIVLYLYVSHDRAGRSTGVCKTSIACRSLFFSLFVDRVRCGSKQTKKNIFFWISCIYRNWCVLRASWACEWWKSRANERKNRNAGLAFAQYTQTEHASYETHRNWARHLKSLKYLD